MISALYLMLLIGYVFLAIGMLCKQELFTGLMSLLLVMLGLSIISNGLGNVNDQSTIIFGYITTYVGVGALLSEALKHIEDLPI